MFLYVFVYDEDQVGKIFIVLDLDEEVIRLSSAIRMVSPRLALNVLRHPHGIDPAREFQPSEPVVHRDHVLGLLSVNHYLHKCVSKTTLAIALMSGGCKLECGELASTH